MAHLWFTAFSPRPLTEDGSSFSRSLEVGNLQIRLPTQQLAIGLDVFNVFGSKDFQQTFDEGGEILAIRVPPTQARFTVTRYY